MFGTAVSQSCAQAIRSPAPISPINVISWPGAAAAVVGMMLVMTVVGDMAGQAPWPLLQVDTSPSETSVP
jgi:hypothetical protein